MSTRTRHVHRLAAIPALVVVVTFAAATCNPVFGEESGPVRHATLTSAAGYKYGYSGDKVTVTASQQFPSATIASARYFGALTRPTTPTNRPA